MQHRNKLLCRGLGVVGFDTEEDNVRRPDCRGRVGKLRRRDDEVAINRMHTQTVRLDCVKMFAAGEEPNVLAALCEPAAEVSPDAARADDCELHGRVLKIMINKKVYPFVRSCSPGNAGSAKMTFSRSIVTEPGAAPFGLRTYFLSVIATGTILAFFILL